MRSYGSWNVPHPKRNIKYLRYLYAGVFILPDWRRYMWYIFLDKKTVIKGLDSSSIEYLCKAYDGKYCYDVKNRYHGTNKKIIGSFDDWRSIPVEYISAVKPVIIGAPNSNT